MNPANAPETLGASEPSSRIQSPVQNPPGVDLHIEEINLHGFDTLDRHSFTSAIERALTRLMSTKELRATNAKIPQVNGGEFTFAGACEDTEPMASRIAECLYRSLQGQLGPCPKP